jgi:hypothetical protein
VSDNVTPIKKRNDAASTILASIVIGVPLIIPIAWCLGFAWRLSEREPGGGT